MSWDAVVSHLSSSERKYQIVSEGRALTHDEVFSALELDPAFAQYYSELIAASEFPALCWEMPPLAKEQLKQSHEFVLVESPALDRGLADSSAFSAHLSRAEGELVVSFPNLGGDGIMIVPTASEAATCYGHLAEFLRSAGSRQLTGFWREVATRFRAASEDSLCWLSTAGLGVPWLHVRIDSRPKYYRHAPYRRGTV